MDTLSVEKLNELVFVTRREIKLDGATNFRDLGGYPAGAYGITRWNKIFRAGDISKLTDNDLNILKSFNISVDYDLRSTEEYLDSPDRLPDHVLRLELHGVGKGLNPKNPALFNGEIDAKQIIRNIYTDISQFGIVYKPLFNQLLSIEPEKALLFHCTAGKDRTGIGAALVLSALGVKRDLIILDYISTDYYWKSRLMFEELLLKRGVPENIINPVLKADPEYIDAMFYTIDKKFGSIEIFLQSVMGLNEQRLLNLRSVYLYQQ